MTRPRESRSAILAALAGVFLLSAAHEALGDGPLISLNDGDRIVFLGDGFFEREYEYGYIETAITSRFPDLHLTFRNLGWSGDTVWGDARAGFDTAKEGFQRRAALVKELKPNVILVCYGMNESFAGEARLPKFKEGLDALLDSLAETKAKIVLISPIIHENLGPPLPDPAQHNRHLRAYRDAMKDVAQQRELPFVDLISHRIADSLLPERSAPVPPTIDGIHLNEVGYYLGAETTLATIDPEQGVAEQGRAWAVRLDLGGRPCAKVVIAIQGTDIGDNFPTKTGVRFRSIDYILPSYSAPLDAPPGYKSTFRFLSVQGLPQGTYALIVDEREVVRHDAREWGNLVTLYKCPELDQVRALRRLIIEKNKLLFHRLRPQNETYLYLFRKHEQGHMAGEVPQFDPLIAEKEAEIDRLKKPVPHTYELIRVEEGK